MDNNNTNNSEMTPPPPTPKQQGHLAWYINDHNIFTQDFCLYILTCRKGLSTQSPRSCMDLKLTPSRRLMNWGWVLWFGRTLMERWNIHAALSPGLYALMVASACLSTAWACSCTYCKEFISGVIGFGVDVTYDALFIWKAATSRQQNTF